MSANYKRAKLFIFILCISAFGPYVFPNQGLRLEHIVIYGAFSYWIIFKIDINWNKNIFILMVLCLAVLVWMLVVSLQNIEQSTLYRLVAAFENFTQPIALIASINMAIINLSRLEKIELIRYSSIIILSLLSLNAFLALSSAFFDTWPFIKYFVIADDGDFEAASVSQLAQTLGRFSGIFNQPVESGLAYSTGMLICVYLIPSHRSISITAWASLLCLIIGGCLSVSKTFIFGGLPLSLLYWYQLHAKRLKYSFLNITGLLFSASLLVAFLFFFKDVWQGYGFFSSVINIENADNNLIGFFTGSRFGGGESAVGQVFAAVWSESPIVGFGVGLPDKRAIDNAMIEYFLYGGIVGLILYFLILIVIFLAAYNTTIYDKKHGLLLMNLFLLILGAGIGAPVLTLNRSSILLWVLILIIFGLMSKPKPAAIDQ